MCEDCNDVETTNESVASSEEDELCIEEEYTTVNNEEFALMTKSLDLTFLTESSLLNYPNVLITDTGDTSDSTPHDFGMINVKEASTSHAIIDAPGNQTKTTQTGNINGTIWNQYGHEYTCQCSCHSACA